MRVGGGGGAAAAKRQLAHQLRDVGLSLCELRLERLCEIAGGVALADNSTMSVDLLLQQLANCGGGRGL